MLYIQTTAHRSTAQHARPEVLPAMTCFSATCRSQCRALLPAALLHTPGCDWCPSASLPLLPAAGCWQQLQHNMCQDPATPLNTVSAACCQFSPCHVSFKPLYTRPPQPPFLWSQGSMSVWVAAGSLLCWPQSNTAGQLLLRGGCRLPQAHTLLPACPPTPPDHR